MTIADRPLGTGAPGGPSRAATWHQHLFTAVGRWLWLATVSVAASCFVMLVARPAHAQQRDEAAGPRLKTESPYFFVKSDDPTVDRLPLKATEVDVRISGVIADVTVTQHYRNEGQRAIEARYVSRVRPRRP